MGKHHYFSPNLWLTGLYYATWGFGGLTKTSNIFFASSTFYSISSSTTRFKFWLKLILCNSYMDGVCLDLVIIWLWCTREHSSKVVMRHVLYESSFLQHITIQNSKSVQTQSILALSTLLSHFSTTVQSVAAVVFSIFQTFLLVHFIWPCHNIRGMPPSKPHLEFDLLHLFIKFSIVLRNPIEMNYCVSSHSGWQFFSLYLSIILKLLCAGQIPSESMSLSIFLLSLGPSTRRHGPSLGTDSVMGVWQAWRSRGSWWSRWPHWPWFSPWSWWPNDAR